jgi:hypothetical protein
MGTTNTTLRIWFQRGKLDPTMPTHMIVVCDGVDHSDYPVFVKRGQDARVKVRELGGMPNQRVLEVFNLSKPFQAQLGGSREHAMFNY